jgi:hypothetical protein
VSRSTGRVVKVRTRQVPARDVVYGYFPVSVIERTYEIVFDRFVGQPFQSKDTEAAYMKQYEPPPLTVADQCHAQ